MSVTFSPSGKPFEVLPCKYCEESVAMGWTAPGERCHPGCPGTMHGYAGAPECNYANGNARELLEALGQADEELCGRVKHEDLPGFISRIIRVVNSRGINSMARAEQESVGAQGCRVITCGSSSDRWIERFTGVMNVAKWAQENGFDISWG